MVNKKRHPGTSNKQAKGSARAIQTWTFVAFHQPRTFEEKQTTDLVSRYFEYTVIFRELKTGKSFGKQVQYRKENSLSYAISYLYDLTSSWVLFTEAYLKSN